MISFSKILNAFTEEAKNVIQGFVDACKSPTAYQRHESSSEITKKEKYVRNDEIKRDHSTNPDLV